MSCRDNVQIPIFGGTLP